MKRWWFLTVAFFLTSVLSAQEYPAGVVACQPLGDDAIHVSLKLDCEGADSRLCAALNNTPNDQIQLPAIKARCETDPTGDLCALLDRRIEESLSEQLRARRLSGEIGETPFGGPIQNQCMDCDDCLDPACCCYDTCDCMFTWYCNTTFNTYCAAIGESVCGWDNFPQGGRCRLLCRICP